MLENESSAKAVRKRRPAASQCGACAALKDSAPLGELFCGTLRDMRAARRRSCRRAGDECLLRDGRQGGGGR
ncbi:MAG: hypothetical protein NTW86_17675 [Candidatus Sumerlaeota bacterium]|nr:hypothetical protein [Candidatus Sumerlaeota bacterium]